MQSGNLRHRLTIQQDRGTTQAADGNHVASWVTLATVWASGGPLKGQELWDARQAQSEITHVFGVRYSSDLANLSGSVRAIFCDRTLHVKAPRITGERRIEILLECSEAADVPRVLLDPDGLPVGDPSTGDTIGEP